MIGICGDKVPNDAIINGEIAYAYVRIGPTRFKCAGYATPKALEIIRESNEDVRVVMYPGNDYQEIHDQIDA